MSRISETQWIWRDGSFIPWADATIHVLSHSVQFGSSAFEGIRAYATPRGPAIFRLREHLQRLEMYGVGGVEYAKDKCAAYCKDNHAQPCHACTTCHFCRCARRGHYIVLDVLL
jgi:hypothetical protein